MPSTAAVLAVVFDLDGTLFNTEALFHKVATDTLAARGKVFTDEILRAMLGRRAADAGHALKTMSGIGEPADVLLAEVKRRFHAELDAAVHPTPGLFALLAHLERLGLPMAVATSSGREYAEGLLTSHGLLERFSFILGAQDVSRGKPDPEIYRTACARLGLEPAHVLVIEDSPFGVSAAKAAGTFAVGIPHPQSPAEGLAHADMLIHRLDDPALLSRTEPR